MRILFAGHSLADPMGGGELSARVLLSRLARHHHVEVVGAGRVARDYVIDERIRCRDFRVNLLPAPAGIPFHLAALLVERQFRPMVARQIRASTPDLVLMQQPGFLHPSDLPAATRLVVFMRSLVCYGAGDANPSRWKRIAGRAFRTARLRRNRRFLNRADLIVSNSRFLQAALLQRAGVHTQVVTPFIATETLQLPAAEGAREYLTFVGMDEWKGASMALRLAEALPERRFLFLAGARGSSHVRTRADHLGNVTCLDWTDDMGQVFARTRILLMPSLWEEPFGRLPVEAGSCGIPTLASARGGLPESVGDGGIVIDSVQDLPAWVQAVRQLDDPARYASLSEAALRHAATLGADVTLRRFGDLVRRDLALELWEPRSPGERV